MFIINTLSIRVFLRQRNGFYEVYNSIQLNSSQLISFSFFLLFFILKTFNDIEWVAIFCNHLHYYADANGVCVCWIHVSRQCASHQCYTMNFTSLPSYN